MVDYEAEIAEREKIIRDYNEQLVKYRDENDKLKSTIMEFIWNVEEATASLTISERAKLQEVINNAKELVGSPGRPLSERYR